MKTLKLFNAVVAKKSKANNKPFVSEDGFIIESDALWAKNKIVQYYAKEKLSGNDLNKTFHKSWEKIQNSSELTLLIEQIVHYFTTYGTNFTTEAYIPKGELNIPVDLRFKVIKAYTKDEMTEKCLNLLQSGIALTEETIDDVLSILSDELNYKFTGKEGIRNKEAIIKIADMYNVLPDDTMEFFRYIIYRSTNESLLIKNERTISAIKASKFNPAVQFKEFGLERLAEIFNRFKPLFLAYKPKCSGVINKISKLSKKHHKALVQNPLNNATQELLTAKELHWLENATVFSLIKTLWACQKRINGQTTYIYHIRNGKAYAAKNENVNIDVASKNFDFIMNFMEEKFSLDGIKVFLPKDVSYGLPTSEKMFVGNFPTGTRFFAEKMAAGIYWENSWGANDLDLSSVDISGNKVGWNASLRNEGRTLLHSGDLTNASNGAVEYLYAQNGLDSPSIVLNNVYSGNYDCEYKIIIGKGNDITTKYMMDPNNLFMEAKCKSVGKETILGFILPEEGGERQSFVLLNSSIGNLPVSGNSPAVQLAITALTEEWTGNPMTFNDLIMLLGAEIVSEKEEADVDLSLDKVEKDSFVNLLQGKIQKKPETIKEKVVEQQ